MNIDGESARTVIVVVVVIVAKKAFLFISLPIRSINYISDNMIFTLELLQ